MSLTLVFTALEGCLLKLLHPRLENLTVHAVRIMLLVAGTGTCNRLKWQFSSINYYSKERHQVLTWVSLTLTGKVEKRNEMEEMRDYRLYLYFPKQTTQFFLRSQTWNPWKE